MYKILASLFATMLLAALLTPFIRQLAFKVGAVDNPNARRLIKSPCRQWVVWQSFCHLI